MQFKPKGWTIKILLMIVCFWGYALQAQDTKHSSGGIRVAYSFSDSLVSQDVLKEWLPVSFKDRFQCREQLGMIKSKMQQLGFLAASIDTVVQTDTLLKVKIFTGEKYNRFAIRVNSVENSMVVEDALHEAEFPDVITLPAWTTAQAKLLQFFENSGYPFASIGLDSVSFSQQQVSAVLQIDKGPLYKIDSISLKGGLKLNDFFLQEYLDILNGSAYSKKKLNAVDKKLSQLAFATVVQPSDVTMLGTGAVLNVYLQPKKNSQFNVLVGLQPSSGGASKTSLTGDALLNLKNLFGKGERIDFKWQQLLPHSPRLNLGFNKPFIFHTKFGYDFNFDLYKKDSAYLTLNIRSGLVLTPSVSHQVNFFLQWQQNSVLPGGVDTTKIKQQKKLPEVIDVHALNVGLTWSWNNTGLIILPRKGTEFNLTVLSGSRKIESNQDILAIKDSTVNYAHLYDSIRLKSFQIRIMGDAAHYFPIKKSTVWKTGLQFGWYSTASFFSNDLFQIGGFKTLRGFDEESIFASRYVVWSNELRLLFGTNSYLSFFADWGKTRYETGSLKRLNRFVSAGAGLMYETKAGLLQVIYAVGKRNDVDFSLANSSKIHFGYINYF